MRKRVLVIGGGAREHVLGTLFTKEELFFAPGNGGTAALGTNLPIKADDLEGLVAFARDFSVDLVVVGPEAPLAAGIVDLLQLAGVPAFGPTRAGARLEGSKSFMKGFAVRAQIPTADFRTFDDAEEAQAFVSEAKRPLVVKADGLAAGKGVVVAADTEEALRAVRSMMLERKFGDAGARVVIEEILPGKEASFHVVVDGEWYLPLPAAQDHKRVFEHDRGPNTGGMGCVAPANTVTPEIREKTLRRIIEPAVLQLARDGIPFRGVLFAGLMIDQGEPQLLEFNVRFGDPEATVLLPGIEGDFFAFLRDPKSTPIETPSTPSVSIVLAAAGYPHAPRTGDTISGLERVREMEGVALFHAGTQQRDDRLVTSGGRVLVVAAKGTTSDAARLRAIDAAEAVSFEGKHFRRDIGAS